MISRSVATDCYGGKELAKAFAMISAVNGLALYWLRWGRSYVEIYQLVGYFVFYCFRSSVAFTLLAPEEPLPPERRIDVPAFLLSGLFCLFSKNVGLWTMCSYKLSFLE